MSSYASTITTPTSATRTPIAKSHGSRPTNENTTPHVITNSEMKSVPHRTCTGLSALASSAVGMRPARSHAAIALCSAPWYANKRRANAERLNAPR